MKHKEVNISVEVVVASRALEPAVILRVGDRFINLPSGTAIEIGNWLIQAAEAAVHDATVLHVLLEDNQLTIKQAALFLAAVRKRLERT